MILNMSGGGTLPTPEEIGALSMELLWENASPTSAFAAQTVNLDLSAFQMVAVAIADHLYFVPIGGTTRFSYIYNANGEQSIFTYVRQVVVSETGVTFGNCYGSSIASGNLKTETSNGSSRPSKIYGIKGVPA